VNIDKVNLLFKALNDSDDITKFVDFFYKSMLIGPMTDNANSLKYITTTTNSSSEYHEMMMVRGGGGVPNCSSGNVMMEATLTKLQRACEEKLLKIHSYKQSTTSNRLEIEKIRQDTIPLSTNQKLQLEIAKAELEIGTIAIYSF
jgi:hypothetical protein